MRASGILYRGVLAAACCLAVGRADAGATVGVLTVQATVPELCLISTSPASLRCTSANAYQLSTIAGSPRGHGSASSTTSDGVLTVTY